METAFTSGQLKQVLSLLDGAKMTHERFQVVLRSGVLADVFDPDAEFGHRSEVQAALRIGDPPGSVRFCDLYAGEPLSQMITDAGFNSVNPGIIVAGRFPITTSIEVRSFEATCHGSGWWGVNHKKAPWREAKIEHLLAYARKAPEEEWEIPIVALGSKVRIEQGGVVHDYAPCLRLLFEARALELLRLDGYTTPYLRLVVREPLPV